MYNYVPDTWPSVAITSLSLRDFRGIATLDLDFRGPDGNPNSLVVLAGPNGCGKTAVLEAAVFLVGGSDLLVGRKDESAIRRGAKNYSIQAALQSGADRFTNRHECFRPAILPIPKPIPHWYFSSWRAPELPGPVDVTVGKPGRRPVKTDQNRLLDVKQRLVNAATVELFQKPLPPFGRYSAWMPIISEAWREFYPETGQDFAVELVSPSDEDASGSFDVYLRTAEGDRREVDLLSAGQIELFLFLAELAMNENRAGIIFIDEPELHLDPQWHRLILRTLGRLQPRAQLIVATHSPEIYDAAASYQRHFLVPENDPRSWLWAKNKTVESGV
jgi:energy-coupling factor transporter ATP-binding protein EcfA2